MDDKAVPLVELWRGARLESLHRGHIAIWRHGTGLIGGWGDADAMIYPRSSSKMIQALPLVESGAAAAQGLSREQLALACASHNGAAIHTERVTRWLADLGSDEAALRCGTQEPSDIEARDALIRAGARPDQRHNNCSGKHCGFLALSRHLGGGPEYLELDHPVQRAIRETWDALTDRPADAGYGIDGCSAPNFVTPLAGLAKAMAAFAAADADGGVRQGAMVQLRTAMMAHPDLVAGEGQACTRLMRAAAGRAAVKTGAEAVFVGIVPEQHIGIALKISDGGTRAAEAAIAAILVSLGVLQADDPVALAYTANTLPNRRGIPTGSTRVVQTLSEWRP